jgi:protocatechuate 3,4-dioxygenase beta subunit
MWASFGIDNNPNYRGVTLAAGSGNLWEGKRNIALLDEYDLPAISSGLPIGSESPAFSPQHVAGPDTGSHACPMCKYGYNPGVIMFVNTDTDWENVIAVCKRLEEESIVRKSEKFKAYLVYTNPTGLSTKQLETKLKQFTDRLSLKHVAVTYVPSVDDKETEMNLNNINGNTSNTLIVYNKRLVFDKFINFLPTEKNFRLLFNSVTAAGKSNLTLPVKKGT